MRWHPWRLGLGLGVGFRGKGRVTHGGADGEDALAAVGGGVAADEGAVVGEALPAAARVLQVEGGRVRVRVRVRGRDRVRVRL